jgi:hypothetical protein
LCPSRRPSKPRRLEPSLAVSVRTPRRMRVWQTRPWWRRLGTHRPWDLCPVRIWLNVRRTRAGSLSENSKVVPMLSARSPNHPIPDSRAPSSIGPKPRRRGSVANQWLATPDARLPRSACFPARHRYSPHHLQVTQQTKPQATPRHFECRGGASRGPSFRTTAGESPWLRGQEGAPRRPGGGRRTVCVHGDTVSFAAPMGRNASKSAREPRGALGWLTRRRPRTASAIRVS